MSEKKVSEKKSRKEKNMTYDEIGVQNVDIVQEEREDISAKKLNQRSRQNLFDYDKTSFNLQGSKEFTSGDKNGQYQPKVSSRNVSPSPDMMKNSSPNKLYRIDVDQMMFKEYRPLGRKASGSGTH